MLNDKLNWNDLRYFVEVAHKGRLLSAAKRLGVNHTTVARRISALEEALEVKLFDQDEHGFHLTEVGENLLPLAQQMEDITALAKEQAQQMGQTVSGNIRIGAPDGFGNTFLAEKLISFIRENPGITIESAALPLFPNLLKREVDIAISLEETASKHIYCRKITDYKLYLYTSKKFIEDQQVDLNQKYEILKHPFVGYIPELQYTEELEFLHLIDKELQSQYQSSTVWAQLQFIAHGGGFGVLPYYMAYNDPRLIPILTEEVSFIRSYWLHIPLELRRMASIRKLEQTIMLEARGHQKIFMPDSAF
ncbi:LysR family transcriptional regulator [Curvivirga aplysinae]|uniref:LysR family transcriptional regulator n=1 Tax=Curvivirga aplysinae TaxID=2529852 RepID=UPI0012BB8387|nr:LysR family transcriptional regulator [Curvivirga aplysinae]MTI10987.1 LysR family transcriptional regulator [Curvivirga aplysinae]